MNCDRCGNKMLAYTTSFFNVDKICDDCYDRERAHPKFEEAHRVETQAVLRGDYNFPGIGLPDDLKGGG